MQSKSYSDLHECKSSLLFHQRIRPAVGAETPCDFPWVYSSDVFHINVTVSTPNAARKADELKEA
jgi:hypothetical protein